MKKSVSFKIAMVILIYVLFLISSIGIELLPIKETSILNSILQFSCSCILAWFSYSIVKTFKITNDKILANKITNVWLIVLGMIMLLFLLIVTNVPNNVEKILNGGSNLLIVSFLVAISTGIFEESLARLLTFSAFLKMFKTKKYTLVWASIASSCLFGLLHLSNLTMQSFNTTMQQIFYATVLGLCFSVIRIRFNGLSYVVLLHFLIDFQPTIANGAATSSSWGEILLIFMPIAIVSIICLILLNKDNKSLELLV